MQKKTKKTDLITSNVGKNKENQTQNDEKKVDLLNIIVFF